MSIVSRETEIEEGTVILPASRYTYTQEYKTRAFVLWYKLGKPGATKLHENLEIDPSCDGRPSKQVLANWIMDFKEQAIVLDDQVAKELEERLVAEKIEMLDRHAKAGIKMQELAEKYIDEHESEIKVPIALKMWMEGVRIERESRGVPQALQKMLDKSDDELLGEVMKLISKSPVEFEQIEDEENENV